MKKGPAQTDRYLHEMVTNPQLEVADLKGIADIAHRKGVPVIVDSTVIPFTETNLKALGIDVEVVSSTKYISGGGTSLGGLIIGGEERADHPNLSCRGL